MTKIVTRSSPNHNARPSPITALVLHATADTGEMASVDWCCRAESKVSYHLIVGRAGVIHHLVPVSRRAWHAGVSSFDGVPNVNDYSIGVAFANRNDGKEPYPEAQLAAGAALVASYMKLYTAITLDRVTTHAVIAPGRKFDPRPPAFDLAAFKLRLERELLRVA
jgi:N-acetyl-anhydromuramyl-L-alanine amidase AmpD